LRASLTSPDMNTPKANPEGYDKTSVVKAANITVE